ncbi:MAG: hypothetical protein PVG24_10170 [Gammaproteobacteria bacterium]|jgi:uncharacterized membrane protein YfcA
MYGIALGLWIVFIVAAIVYATRARHPETRPLAAFMIFTIVFTTIAFSLFAALTLLAQAMALDAALRNPVAAAIFLAIVFLPAFLGARYVIRRPPRRRAPPP